MAFESLNLNVELEISKVVTIHYFEYTSDYCFPGESHDFWEFLCVDKGEVNVLADERPYTLKKDQIIFHKPNEFHNVTANGITAPNLVVISFECSSPCMKYLEELVTTIGDYEHTLLANILSEAKKCIKTPLVDPSTTKMELVENPPFASEQMIRINLELLLLHMIRLRLDGGHSTPTVKSIKQKNDSRTYENIVAYLEEHICERLTIDEICKDNLIGRFQLQKLFREQNQSGVIDYFSHLKIEFAKQLIRENHHNFTQISDFLGYTSVHYFSRQFKKLTGMTPSEYSSSIKLKAERKH